MATRTNVHNKLLPGVTAEPTMTMGNELCRSAVFKDDEYVGEVIYVARRRKAPPGSPSSTGFVTDYGWRTAKSAPQSKLVSRVEAIRKLPRLAEVKA